MLTKELGPEAMSYNPPYCYAWDTFSINGSDQIVLGLGNRMVLRYKKKGLVVQEIHGELH